MVQLWHEILEFRHRLVESTTGLAVHGKLPDRYPLKRVTRGCAGQAEDEFCEHPFLAVHCNRSIMGLRNDVVADRQAETGSFACWLGREEGLEQLVADVRRDADAVVPHADLDAASDRAGGDLELRL